MTALPAPWRRALDRRRRLFDLSDSGLCARMLDDEDPSLRCDRYGPVCWFSWYGGASPGPEDFGRLAAFTGAAGAVHWHLRHMPDRGRDPGLRRTWSSPGAPETWVAAEAGLRFELRAGGGQSAGLYLDQRRNRGWVRDHARGARVLNLFAYTGGFGIAALAGGAAEVVQNDVSRTNLDWARENAALNGMGAAAVEYAAVDARLLVGGCRSRGRRFDAVICDPPAFARSRGRDAGPWRVERDLPAVVRECVGLLSPEGWMLVSSGCESWEEGAFEGAVRRGLAAGGRMEPAPGPGQDCGGARGRLRSVVVRPG